MQIGQTIWAIDPCYDGSGENPRLTVGESYEVISISDDEIKIKNDFGRPHYFTFDKFDKYFSFTPPKEVKEGVFKKCGEGENTCSCNNASECGYLNQGVCKHCGAENAMRWDKQQVGIEDKNRTWLCLNIRHCRECGNVDSYELVKL